MSYYKGNTYASAKKFGARTLPPGNNDPLTMCLVDTMDKSFQHGGIAHLYGPRSSKCQNYMSQRCADKWDGFCEYFYRENQPQSGQSNWPNNQLWPIERAREWEVRSNLPTMLSTGDNLVRNAAERKFCTFTDCEQKCEPFNPTDPNSPMISYYSGSCIPSCKVDPKTADREVLLDRMMENPKASAGTLINICNTAKNNNQNLGNTKIGKFCERYFDKMNH